MTVLGKHISCYSVICLLKVPLLFTDEPVLTNGKDEKLNDWKTFLTSFAFSE
jgi:hypothetical protein